MVPGMHVLSYASYERSTKAEEWTRVSTWDACTLSIDPVEVDWCWGVHWTVWQVLLPKKENIDIGKFAILSSGTGTSMDITFPFFFMLSDLMR